jgi:hypothetical protein
MKYLIVPVLALGLATAAGAATGSPATVAGAVPACSKTVTDNCMEHSAKPARVAKPAHHARRAHHAGKAAMTHTAKPAKKAG